MNASQNLSKHVVLTIDDNTYSVKYPTIGQLMKIETVKSIYSGGQYGSLVRTGTKASNRALDLIDMVAHFTVLIPQLNEQFIGIKSIEDIDIVIGMKLVEVYNKSLKPFLEQWEKAIAEPIATSKEISEEAQIED